MCRDLRGASVILGMNMLAIEQYDTAVERIAGLVEDGKILRQRRNDLVGIAEKLESERKRDYY